mmetsp:Transcript_95058/g.290770  ORF Transcript_95058/g.290770 Transcript_95058/m.290770 type:complete len:251 (-) Transcript_95058:73-825(-)
MFHRAHFQNRPRRGPAAETRDVEEDEEEEEEREEEEPDRGEQGTPDGAMWLSFLEASSGRTTAPEITKCTRAPSTVKCATIAAAKAPTEAPLSKRSVATVPFSAETSTSMPPLGTCLAGPAMKVGAAMPLPAILFRATRLGCKSRSSHRSSCASSKALPFWRTASNTSLRSLFHTFGASLMARPCSRTAASKKSSSSSNSWWQKHKAVRHLGSSRIILCNMAPAVWKAWPSCRSASSTIAWLFRRPSGAC